MLKANTKDYAHPIAVKEFKAAMRQLGKEGGLTVDEVPIYLGLDVRKGHTSFEAANSFTTDLSEQRWYFSLKVSDLSSSYQCFGPYEDARAALLARDRLLTQIRQVLQAARHTEPRPHWVTAEGTPIYARKSTDQNGVNEEEG